MAEDRPFFTIGHSTKPIPDFIDQLRSADVNMVVDVRTMPRSRTNPQFNFDVLPDSLAAHGFAYRHIRELGGLRGKRPGGEPSPNLHWDNKSFRNYADYAMGPAFHAGFETLLALGRERRCAIMCAEAVWWRCHRRIIADYLLDAGEEVFHIMGEDRLEPARMTPAARRLEPGILVYPADHPQACLDFGGPA